MDPDLDDTRAARPRAPAPIDGADLDDTVVSRRLDTGAAQRAAIPAERAPAPSGSTPDSAEDAAPLDRRVVGAPRAAYGLRVGESHAVIALDRVTFLGRKPSSPRISQGDFPRLVRVPSALKEVSSTHLEIAVRGASIVVTDLKSKNGSTVFVPGDEPRTLRDGASMVVTPHTLIDIGEGNVVEIVHFTAHGTGADGAHPGIEGEK